jgi:hypothetical protein
MRRLLRKTFVLIMTTLMALTIMSRPGDATPQTGSNSPGAITPVQVGPSSGGGGITVTFTVGSGSGSPGQGAAGGPAGGGLGGGPGNGSAPVNPWNPANIAACQAQSGGLGVLIPCPQAGPAAPAAPPPPQPGASIVSGATLTLQRQLPQPSLTVQPGYAVTGLRAYLQIGTPDNRPFTFQGFENAVSMLCSWTSFDVAWGDGTVDNGVSSTGGPWPNGDVTHVYQQASPQDDLMVTEHWSCPWHDQIGGAGLLALETQGDLPLEVREIQTVEG